ncbi:MAG: hypothetical protein GXP05_09675 [Alphaproteobacteria bacterium]|nr:hypothetical protein [Alphaproteobacteria bacterium]
MFVLLMILGAPVWAAQVRCGNHTKIVENLRAVFGEQLFAQGLSGPTAAVEFYANPKSGTWTVLIIGANGTTCIPATGESWQGIDLRPVSKPPNL